jgi:hypothetical protein
MCVVSVISVTVNYYSLHCHLLLPYLLGTHQYCVDDGSDGSI